MYRLAIFALCGTMTVVGCGKKDKDKATDKVEKPAPEDKATAVEPPVKPPAKDTGTTPPATATATGDIATEEVTYQGGGVTMKGYLAYDKKQTGKRPGVLVVHEWWGHNEYARERTRMLAQLGYVALAVDMFGDGKQAAHPEDAGKFTQEVFQNLDQAKERFVAALDLLKKHASTDPERVAAIGYCFGGGVVLHAARMGVDLDGVVSFHGSLDTQMPAKAGEVKAKVLVCNGADDPFVKAESIAAFKKEMTDAKVDMRFESYVGAKHSFTSKHADEYGTKFKMPLAYNAEADQKSWTAMQAFFQEIFK